MSSQNSEQSLIAGRLSGLVQNYLLNRWWWLLPIMLWGGLVALSFGLTVSSINDHSREIAKESARNLFNTIVLARKWNAAHGGVYVPVTEKSQPNPYLDVPYRDIVTKDNRLFTLINPAYMTRQISELAQQGNDTVFHITSLKPIRPANKADPWETVALKRFETEGAKEISERVTTAGSDLFRYMAPLTTEAACLACHAKQGYKLGDIRGGISVSLQARPIFSGVEARIAQEATRHGILFLIISALMMLAFELIRHQFLSLQRVRDRQEQTIAERTRSLEVSNRHLSQEVEARKAAQEELHKLSRVVEQVPYSVVITNTVSEIEYVNPAFTAITGYSSEEALGKNLRLQSSGKTPEETYRDFWQTLSRGEVWHGEFTNVNKQGRERLDRVIIFPIVDNDGETTHYASIQHDITRERERDLKLERNQARLNAVVENAADGIITINEQDIIVAFNRAAEEIFGLSSEAVIGGPISVIIPQELREAHYQGFNRYLQTGESRVIGQRVEIKGLHSSGRQVDIELAINEVVAAGERQFTALIRDVTEKKQAEAALHLAHESLREEREHLAESVAQRTRELQLSNEELQRTGRAKDQFLANMSHEIRTPMNAIIGMSHLALKAGLEGKQRNYIEKVHYSAENLLGILNDILDFTKIESGKLDMEQVDFHLRDVMDQLDNMVGIKTREKGMKLRVDIAQDVPEALVGDPLRLGQILINLGNNALKFTEQLGKIDVAVGIKEQSDRDVLLQFSVRDNGIGMTDDQLEKLFRTFSQADSSTTRKYGGTGLGLAISKRLTELMGGEIWVESEYGEGSTFFFTARFIKQQGESATRRPLVEQSRQETTEAISKLRGARVLLVEDNEINRELAQELLAGNGLEVVSANNGREALTLIDSSDFDGVIMDCQMPVMDGYTASRKIREQERLKDLPVIAMTANVMAEDRERMQQSGMNDHIAKPIDVDQMFVTLAKWITPSAPPMAEEIPQPQQKSTDPEESIPEMTGIDTKAGLATTQQNANLYRKLLRKFGMAQQDFRQKFLHAQADQDPEAATRLAHSLKGSAGNLGIRGVQAAALALEVACKSKPELIDDKLAIVVAELVPVIQELTRLDTSPPEETEGIPKEFDREAVRHRLQQLGEALQGADVRSGEIIDDLRSILTGTEFAAALDGVALFVDGYDFDAALEQLDKLVGEIDAGR